MAKKSILNENNTLRQYVMDKNTKKQMDKQAGQVISVISGNHELTNNDIENKLKLEANKHLTSLYKYIKNKTTNIPLPPKNMQQFLDDGTTIEEQHAVADIISHNHKPEVNSETDEIVESAEAVMGKDD